MSETKTEVTEAKEFKDIYNDLNDSKKAILRTGFLEEHGYRSFDSFYKKMKGETLFRPNEQKWICKQLQISESEVKFPTRETNGETN